ncbi:MAG: hypothetical protein BroJett005_21990 [Ignavibacteriota bacterium]|nr:MAG: hypothetical protein BroJett005_21990 [Ignavibacteriota bacterium]
MTTEKLKDILYNNALKRRTSDQLGELANKKYSSDQLKKIFTGKSRTRDEYFMVEFAKDIFHIIDSAVALDKYSFEDLIKENKIIDESKILLCQQIHQNISEFGNNVKEQIKRTYEYIWYD